MKWYFRSGMLISFVGSIVIVGLCILFGRPICALFGADAETLEYTCAICRSMRGRLSWSA